MNLRDVELENIIKNKISVTINNKEYIVESNPIGTCDGCYFLDKDCPAKAVSICCSNGGNIFKIMKPTTK